MPYINELQYSRGMRALSSAPPEQRAVKDYTPLVSGLAQSDAQRYVEGVNRSTERERMNAILNDARRDRRMAIADSRIALPVTLGKVGLDALGAQEQRAQTRQAELDAQATKDLVDSLRIIIRDYPRDIDLLFQGMHPSQKGTQSSGMQPIAPAQMIGGG